MANGYGNNGRNEDSPGWLERFEHAQEIQNAQIGELTKNVSALTATVSTLGSQQKALFGRADRPYPWGALISAVTLLVLGATLIVSPMKEDLDQQRSFDTHTNDLMLKHFEDVGAMKENLVWLNKLEARLNQRLHDVRNTRKD